MTLGAQNITPVNQIRPDSQSAIVEPKRILQAYTLASHEACSSEYRFEFLKDLKNLITSKKNFDFCKYCYAPYHTKDQKSGTLLWDDTIMMGDNSGYYIPKQEKTLIYRYREFLQHVFSPISPYALMAGPGTPWARLAKEVPTLRAIAASGASAWDLNPKFAYGAAGDIERELGIPAQAIVGDFTKALPDGISLPESSPIFITMFGSTATQFPLHSNNDENATSFCKMLTNLHEQTHGNGFLLLTIDANVVPERAIDCYSGRHFRTWQNWLWSFVGCMTQDERFNPRVIKYFPQYNEQTNAVIHSHIVMEDTKLKIGTERFALKNGDKLHIGMSQKWTPEEIRETALDCSWKELLVLRDEGTVRGILYMDKNMPDAWANHVQTAIKSAPKAMLG